MLSSTLYRHERSYINRELSLFDHLSKIDINMERILVYWTIHWKQTKKTLNQQAANTINFKNVIRYAMVTWLFDDGSLEVVFLDLKHRFELLFTKLLLKYNRQ